MCLIVPDTDAARKRAETILLFADDGLSIKQIAHDLFLAERTVTRHLRVAVSTMPTNRMRAAQALLDALESEATE